MADEPFQVDTSSRLLFPMRSASDHFAIAVNFDAARYGLSSVTMLPTSSGPGGVPLVPNADVTVGLSNDAAIGHSVLELRPHAASLRFPGEYRIALILVGKSLDSAARAVSSNVTISILRLEPQIDFESMTGHSTTLYRLFPWTAASGSVQYPLQSVKSSDAAELSLAPMGLQWLNSKELVPDASVIVAPAHLDLDPGHTQNVDVTLSKLRFAGDFVTTLALDSDSLSSRHPITLAVHVKDRPWIPLLVIIMGVLGGTWVTWLSGDRRSTLQARYRLSELRMRLQKLGPAIVLPATARQYQRISAKLDSLQRSAGVDLGSATEWEAVAKKVATLENMLATTQAEVGSRLDLLDVGINALQAALLPDVPDIVLRTQPVAARIAAIRAINSGGQYEYAMQQTAAAEQMFQVVSRDARLQAVDDASLKVSAHLQSGADKNLAGKFNELRRTAVSASLLDFMTGMGDLHQDLVNLGVEAPSRLIAVRDQPRPMPLPDYVIQVTTAEGSRITGQLIDMDVAVSGGRPSPDRVVWNFGNGILNVVSGSLRASAIYDWPGPYTVSAQLYRDADLGFHEAVTTSITVQAGSAARQVAQAAGALIRNELLVVAIAILLAAVTGLLQLYVGKSFGSVEDYLVALLWGFGIEKSIRGFNAVYASLGMHR